MSASSLLHNGSLWNILAQSLRNHTLLYKRSKTTQICMCVCIAIENMPNISVPTWKLTVAQVTDPIKRKYAGMVGIDVRAVHFYNCHRLHISNSRPVLRGYYKILSMFHYWDKSSNYLILWQTQDHSDTVPHWNMGFISRLCLGNLQNMFKMFTMTCLYILVVLYL